MIQTTGLLLTALLFGGMVLYSFGFAAFVFSALPAETARAALRSAFPHFYIFVMASSAAAAALVWPSNPASALWLAAIALTTLPARQLLMPAINHATDAGEKKRFAVLHSASVLLTLAHIAIAGYVLSRFL
jgi:Domain of unknown function (DUF4149)